ncbi:MAG: hypothetical protein ABL955_09255, partial [Elusimicrobiota bacterium]
MRAYLPILACALILSAIGVRAEEGDAQPVGVKFGARGTVGTGGYLGRGAHLQYGDAWRIKGSYSDYRFDGSTGTRRTAGLRASYQGENLSVGLNASVTPRNDNYANRSFGADGGWTFLFNEESEDGAGLEELELGAFWSQTRHSQIVPGTVALPTERNLIINQHDLGLTAALTGWDFTLSLDASRSIYDQEFDNLPAAVRRRPRLAEAASLVNGFPERQGSARLEYGRWRACVPYISAAATRYSIQPQPASLTSGAGVSLKY